MGLDLIPLNFPLGCGPGGGVLLPGRVPSSWGVSLAGGSPSQGVSLAGGFSYLGGCLLPGGSPWWGSPWQGVLLSGDLLSRGVLLSGGDASLGGGSPGRGVLLSVGVPPSCGGGSIPACTEADPPVDRITDTSKNITLATTSLRPVNIPKRGTICILL